MGSYSCPFAILSVVLKRMGSCLVNVMKTMNQHKNKLVG